MNLDDQIDRLYQLPLKEFTPARNALAKQVRGADATRVRESQKPNAAAWGVNQLYWRHRSAYDRLVNASDELRKVHRSLLAGKSVALSESEAAHRAAIRDATQKIREILAEAGESDSAATLMAIGETLEALPSGDEPPGRLTRPLRRMGFEVLAGVGPRSPSAAPPKLSLVSSRAEKTPPKAEIPPARQRELADLEGRLRAAQLDERQLLTDLERARRELDRADRDHARIAQELAEATDKLKRVRSELAAKEKAHRASVAEQARLEERLDKLRSR